MNEVARPLSVIKRPIAEISAQVGYSNPEYHLMTRQAINSEKVYRGMMPR